MHTSVPRPDAIVHDVTLFLLNPPHLDAAGRGEWERARAAIASLASGPCASTDGSAKGVQESSFVDTPQPITNVVRLFPRPGRGLR